MIAARLSSRIHWDLGLVMECSICGLLTPVYTEDEINLAVPVPHYPESDDDAYIPGGYCRGGRQPALPPSQEIQIARSAERA